MPVDTQTMRQATEALKQWTIGSPSGQPSVMPMNEWNENSHPNSLNLLNSDVNLFLHFEEQHTGINLGWTDDTSPSTARSRARWIMRRESGSSNPIQYGENVAIGFGRNPTWYKHEERTFGINLVSAKAPSFEWIILGGRKGTPVRTGAKAAIFNTQVSIGNGAKGDFFVHHDRDLAAAIGWTTSPDNTIGGIITRLLGGITPGDILKLSALLLA
jgi:hypothetical protein